MRVPIPHRTFPRRLLTLCLAVAAFVLPMPAAAQAAETYDLRAYGTKCVSGQTDERRYLYVVCQNEINEGYMRVVRPDGTIEQTFRVPGANDSAPAPDGSYVYVSGGGAYPLRRWDKGANGLYVENKAYVAPTFKLWGTTYPAKGRQIATDAYGNLYVANGVWTTELLHVVVKFAPDGRYITHFGDFTNTWATSKFYSLSGIAVSRDGRYIYTSELHNGRVQRFDRRADGTYGFGLAWGNSAVTDPFRLGWCVPGLLAAPYDIAVDGWGDVWTSSTSCTYLQKFDADGVFKYASFVGNRGTVGPGVMPNGTNQTSHNLAIDGNGNAISGETSTWLVRTGAIPAWPTVDAAPAPAPVPDPGPAPAPDPAPDPGPAPGQVDLAAPIVTAVTIPATSTTSLINVAITATDDIGVATARMATDDGDDWTAWRAFAPTMTFTLRPGLGNRGVYVQVRDAVGRESNIVYRNIVVVEGVAPAPVPIPDPGPAPAPVPDPIPVPAPGDPDRTAPTLRGATTPATARTSLIDVVIDAFDDRAVTQVRMATDNGDDWTAWQPFAPTTPFTLRAGLGYRGVYIQVRDAAGNASAILYRRTTVVA